jgi:hypothetical protein
MQRPWLLIVGIAVFEMPLCVAGSACDGSYRQPKKTRTLFEIATRAEGQIKEVERLRYFGAFLTLFLALFFKAVFLGRPIDLG